MLSRAECPLLKPDALLVGEKTHTKTFLPLEMPSRIELTEMCYDRNSRHSRFVPYPHRLPNGNDQQPGIPLEHIKPGRDAGFQETTFFVRSQLERART